MDYKESKEYKEAKEQAESKLEMEISLQQHLEKEFGKEFVEGMKRKPALLNQLKFELDPITKEVKVINNGK